MFFIFSANLLVFYAKKVDMQRNCEWKTLLTGSKLATDEALRKRLSVDYDLSTANTLAKALKLIEVGDIDVVVTEQQYTDERGVNFLK